LLYDYAGALKMCKLEFVYDLPSRIIFKVNPENNATLHDFYLTIGGVLKAQIYNWYSGTLGLREPK